ncbi:lipid-A-disaccharide synthase-related protein [Calothrix sp. UHCC 0171]|uniref:lipid-A-disaccharide synthase-related protein n=1 Tax=Calothrix sp. UHCC 0171 TaxID=3110245 RepID=UPI002B215DCD|nr:lipid-A-disaccharide synthase-related protein [Calothrix sp. UHCC 0171]MEA5571786.1 lipid-A-disaccharide synthase-related protein [Calothrix sp. UHCC 0171]
MTSQLQLLILSNGHGEDVIAVRILKELLQLENPPKISALPLVGEGYAYQKLNIPIVGSVKTMPSGGFIYMDAGQQLMRDVQGGLLKLTLNQIQTTREWVQAQKQAGNRSAVLAVGDILPLLFASISGANYAFVGTAKSEYYVRDDAGLLKRTNKGAYWENFSGSIYHPWERWLMTRQRCKAVFPRDSLTTKILQEMRVPVFDLGNPMMDNLQPSFPTHRVYATDAEHQEIIRPLAVTLLPGSRIPEAYDNWEQIMIAVSSLMETMLERNSVSHGSKILIFLGAIAPNLDSTILAQFVTSHGWKPHPITELPVKFSDRKALTFKQRNAYFVLTQNAYNDCLHMADIAIAMAGTATEQFVGLGKPALTIPGKGPQFNPIFAEAQSRLLGNSVILVPHAENLGKQVKNLLADPDKLHAIAENGLLRMGKPGAAQRIAECIMERLS